LLYLTNKAVSSDRLVSSFFTNISFYKIAFQGQF